MTSLINPTNIDGTYPIAGQDNDSQGFRDNFTNIKNNLETARLEITALQDADSAPKVEDVHYYVLTNASVTQLLAGTVAIFAPAATLATSTITMPVSPVNGATITVTFNGTVTALAMNGGTIYSPLTTATSSTRAKWVYSTSGSGWYRIS